MQVDHSRQLGNEQVVMRPRARMESLNITDTGAEVLLYDTTNHQMHQMNPAATAVWRASDGQHTVAEIGRMTGLEDDAVWLGLQLLADKGLLKDGFEPGPRLGRRQTRRAFLKKASLAAIPAIVSITAPIAKAAASSGICLGKWADCNLGDVCCPGLSCTATPFNSGACE